MPDYVVVWSGRGALPGCDPQPRNGWDGSGSHGQILGASPGRKRTSGTVAPTPAPPPAPQTRSIQSKTCGCGRAYQGLSRRCAACRSNGHRIVSHRAGEAA